MSDLLKVLNKFKLQAEWRNSESYKRVQKQLFDARIKQLVNKLEAKRIEHQLTK